MRGGGHPGRAAPPGCGTTIKHFALNNQEDNRNHNNAHCTERALREIYLKGFEIAVRTAQPLALMSSYNLVNGIHSANNRELLTDILRDEWGFAGLVMTDWGTTDASTGFKYGSSATAGCVLAGNDLTMPGSQQDVDAILDALKAWHAPLAAAAAMRPSRPGPGSTLHAGPSEYQGMSMPSHHPRKRLADETTEQTAGGEPLSAAV